MRPILRDSTQDSDLETRRRKYIVGLWLRVVAAGVFLLFLSVLASM